MRKVLLVNLGLMMAAMIVIELSFGNWINPKKFSQINIRKNLEFHYDVSGLYGKPGDTAHVVRDQYGLRGKYSSPSEIDILTVGGSTTDQAYVTDGQTWQDVLSQCLSKPQKRISVVNAGMDGQTTYGHIRNFDYWFSEIPDFKPKFILAYIGINDYFAPIDGAQTSDFDDLNMRNASIATRLKLKSALYQFFRGVVGSLRAYKHKLRHRKADFVNQSWVEFRPSLSDSQLRKTAAKNLELYEKRIQAMIDRIRRVGATPIIVTQTTNEAKKIRGRWVVVDGETEFNDVKMNTADSARIKAFFNSSALKVCSKNRGVCLDLASDVSFEDEDYYDFIHNTPKGAEKIGRYLCKKLSPNF